MLEQNQSSSKLPAVTAVAIALTGAGWWLYNFFPQKPCDINSRFKPSIPMLDDSKNTSVGAQNNKNFCDYDLGVAFLTALLCVLSAISMGLIFLSAVECCVKRSVEKASMFGSYGTSNETDEKRLAAPTVTI